MKPDLRIVVSNAAPSAARPASAPSTPAGLPPASDSATSAVPDLASGAEQVEMPFAVVNGEPITVLPRDLYIPPQALEIFLEAFEGPLDLLLYLIRRQNVDVLNIPIAQITRQYMQYIELMQELQLELAGEYLVMAATLAEIKSRMLLPRPAEQALGEEDPRAELVRRLQEYERFKRAAADIDALPRLERDAWQASADWSYRPALRALPQVTLQEMLVAFKEVAVRAAMFAHHHVQREALSVRERMSSVLSAVQQGGFVEFIRLFRPEEGRSGVTVTFIAVLELMREFLIDVVQNEPYAPLYVRATATEGSGERTLGEREAERALSAAAADEPVIISVEPSEPVRGESTAAERGAAGGDDDRGTQ